jgi:hypothetical protein
MAGSRRLTDPLTQESFQSLPFTRFDELTAGFDRPVLNGVEELRANG